QLQVMLLEEIWLAGIRFLNKKVDISKVSTNSMDKDQTEKINPPIYFGIKTAFRKKR
ncbi:16892_t:CDS:1, partial [Gigaspora rosea]